MTCRCDFIPFQSDQYLIKRTKVEQTFAMQNHQLPPPPLYTYIPTPLWKDSKERVLKEINDSKVKLAISVIDFEQDEMQPKSLGRIVKSDIFRPREVISMTDIQAAAEDEGAVTLLIAGLSNAGSLPSRRVRGDHNH